MEAVTYWLFRIVVFGVGLLSLRAGILAGRMLGIAGYYLLPGYRRLAIENLGIAFPEKSLPERKAIARKHFSLLGGNLLASEKLARMTVQQLLEVVTVEGIEHLRKLTAGGRGFVLLISHIGNWELLAQISPSLFQVPCGTVYRQLGNERIDAYVRQTRGRLGLTLFERKDGFHKAIQMLTAGGGVGILIDQHAGDAGVWCPLFGRLASTTPLAATMALRSGAGLVPTTMYTDGIGRWRFVIEEPVEPVSSDSSEITAQLQSVVEQQIRRQPEDWFWVHRRWKTPNPNFLLANYKRGIAFPPPQVKHQEARELKRFRILVRSSNWLGDAVMSIPAVRDIKRGRPDAHVSVLTPEKLADVWRLVSEVDEVIPFPASGGFGFLGKCAGVFRVAKLVRNRSFDAGVIFPKSLRTGLEIWLAGIPRRVGFPGHWPRAIFLNQVFRDPKPAPAVQRAEHQVHDYLRLARFIGARTADGPAFGFPSGGEQDSPPPAGPIRIAVCPGAEYGPAKRWLPERFAEVIRTVGGTTDCRWLLVGTAKDDPVAREIVTLAGGPPNLENLCGTTTLAELIALLRSCRLLLTNDTGTMHLAALLGLKTVAIFGSTEPLLTGPLGSGHVVIRRKVECNPCFLRECPLDFRCMKAIEAGDVSAAILSITSALAA